MKRMILGILSGITLFASSAAQAWPGPYVAPPPVLHARWGHRGFVGPGVVVTTPPPPLRYEVAPIAPSPGMVWIPGYWSWGGAGYVWIAGHYEAPHYGHLWVAPRWHRYGRHWRFARGYWR